MAEVREKIQEHPVLRRLDPRKVYDKIRSEWCFNDKSNSQPSDVDDNKPSAEQPPKSPELPKASDSLADKIPMKRTAYRWCLLQIQVMCQGTSSVMITGSAYLRYVVAW